MGSSPARSETVQSGHHTWWQPCRAGDWFYAGGPSTEVLIWKTTGITFLTMNKLGTGEGASDNEPSSVKLNVEVTQVGGYRNTET